MNTARDQAWVDTNRAELLLALAPIREVLSCYVARVRGTPVLETGQSAVSIGAELPLPSDVESALVTLCNAFSLSPFERDLLLMCAGTELDASFAELYAAAHGDERFRHPTFSLALAVLDNAHWSALSPQAPLRYWRLVEVSAGQSLTTSALRIDERILHFLVGVNHLDERLTSVVEPLGPGEELVPSHAQVVAAILDTWTTDRGDGTIIELSGNHPASAQAIAASACRERGLTPYRIPASVIPAVPAERSALARLWQRESRLSDGALVVDVTAEHARLGTATSSLLASAGGARFLISTTPVQCDSLAVTRKAVRKPLRHEQESIWEKALHGAGVAFDPALRAAVSQFDFHPDDILAAVRRTRLELDRQEPAASDSRPARGHRDTASGNDDTEWTDRLVRASRSQARPHMDDVAQRIEAVAEWNDLVLPDGQKDLLDGIVACVRQRRKVYEEWGFARKSARGLGISALFVGASGTGKTMAAEVLAKRLRVDLYRIDLSGVVSKYIGETEKNLRRVFDAADDANVILLFDEADALFGKRSEVKDSHDRYANIEISYLLQRMEAYRGLAILTTNMKEAIDHAFLRRIRFVIRFPFPDIEQRRRIWRGVFPEDTPRSDLDFDRLAQLNLVGGNIRNVAMHAAFIAAENGQPVGMQHLKRAALVEFAKLEQTPTAAEMRAWT